MYAEPLIALLTFVASLGFVYGHRLLPSHLGRAAAVVDQFVDQSQNGIPREKIRQADCIVVIPQFGKAPSRDYSAFGRGYISCQNGNHWSAPAAVTLQTSSSDFAIDSKKLELVALSMNSGNRRKLLSGPENQDSELLIFSRTKGPFAKMSLGEVTLRPDGSANRSLYGKETPPYSNILNGSVDTPKVARVFVDKLTATLN